jgi:hypothetical protein
MRKIRESASIGMRSNVSTGKVSVGQCVSVRVQAVNVKFMFAV